MYCQDGGIVMSIFSVFIHKKRSIVEIEQVLKIVNESVEKVEDKEVNYALVVLFITCLLDGCLFYMTLKGLYSITPDIFLGLGLLWVFISFIWLRVQEVKLNTLVYRYYKVKKLQLEKELKFTRYFNEFL